MKKEKKEEKKEQKKSGFREIFELIAETAVFVFFVMTFVVQAFQIPTGSMEPTLLVGDFLLVNKFIYANTLCGLERKMLPRKKIERQDIIVFKFPQDLKMDFVKRIIGLEGEKVEIRDRQVYINDKPILETYKVHIESQLSSRDNYYYYDDRIKDNFGPVVVPPGHYFVMGDNRDNSQDSRYWGYLPQSNIKGKPWIVYFSYKAEKDAYKKTSVLERLKKLAMFIPMARWKRILLVIK